jgi:uncharacterized membrane protein
MPDRMASHWNIRGEVDGYMPKFWALMIMPVISALLMLLFIALPRIDPLRENIKKFRKQFDTFILILIAFLFYIDLAMIFANLGYLVNMGYVIMPAIAVIIFYAGVLMQSSKRNWFIGVRTPWTLSSETVWDKTNRLGGILFKVYALILLVSAFLLERLDNYFIFILLGPIIAITVFLVVYSYAEYEKENKTKKILRKSK